MNATRRIPAGIRASTLSFFREPLNIALLLILPTLSIQIYGVSLSQFPEIGMFAVTGSLTTVGRITGAVFATGALAGVLGLFQMISARNADRRLVIAGFSPSELVVSRFTTILVVSLAISAVSTVTLTWLLPGTIGAPFIVFSSLALAGITYGLLGMLVGTILPRELEGSLVLVILADMDNVFASGLFNIDDDITQFAPLSHPHELVSRAVVEGSLATDHVLPALAFIAIFGMLSVSAYAYTVSGGDA
ncbi:MULTISPECIES: ABC transporter permease [Halolamina]|uniref:Uncharacterized protein n=1 Tax=Halolamina pelagica TaxID=699431 RepID=A0A1I5UKL6_9EURY|nr:MULTISPECIES: ABC transporter permease [Halolamina]NHX37584.1 ABC transporter permease [Halolamina sp. R1-12]SFP95780.1 hypothetical protein SAMN05216277_11320 [Halolamina pelagica]